eukprot:gene13541-biopygen75
MMKANSMRHMVMKLAPRGGTTAGTSPGSRVKAPAMHDWNDMMYTAIATIDTVPHAVVVDHAGEDEHANHQARAGAITVPTSITIRRFVVIPRITSDSDAESFQAWIRMLPGR